MKHNDKKLNFEATAVARRASNDFLEKRSYSAPEGSRERNYEAWEFNTTCFHFYVVFL